MTKPAAIKARHQKKQRVRPLALCIVRRPDDGRYLVMSGYDPVKQQAFYRPLGGGIKFCEHSQQAIRREMREEIDAELVDLEQIGFFENVFEFAGAPGHELIVMYAARLEDQSLYHCEQFTFTEKKNPGPITAVWRSLADFQDTPLYPDGLLELLQRRESAQQAHGATS